MRKTTNYGLSLYDKEDKMIITAEENSLNANMELIDGALKAKANVGDIPQKLSQLENDEGYLSSIPLDYVTENELSQKNYATESFVSNKIAEAELSGSDVDLSGLATKDELNKKVDKVKGKSLIDDTEITRLSSITNYDDTEIRKSINSKASITDMATYIEEHKEELKGADGKDGTNGTNGKDGTDGQDGFSPTAKVETTSTGATITITDKNGTTITNITNGKDGVDGKDGQDGAKGTDGKDGEKGADGVSATHSWNGTVLSITSASGTSSANLKGEKGDTGQAGKDGTNGINGSNGKDGYTPVKGTDYWTEADKKEIITEVNNVVKKDGVPDYWLSALQEGAEAINTALCEAGSNKSAFLFYSDAHWNYGSQMSPTLLKYLYKHTGMNKTIFGGDIVNDEATDYDTMEYLWEWRKQLKDLPNHHSVVGNHDDGNSTNNLFSENYVYGYLLAPEETNDVVRGVGGMYYYIDNNAEKTRYLYLDTAYQGVNSTQQEFIKQALLTTKDGWHIVVIAHAWYYPDYDQYNVRPIPIKGMDTNASTVVAMLDAYNSRTGDYADCGGWVEFCIGGHVHIDYDGTSSTGIPIILVETDSKHTRSGLSYTAETTTESSVNGIIADYDKHKIYVVRIGRGESREVAITNYVVTYTNQIPLSLAADGTSIYNEKGFKEDVRWSQSGQSESTSTGTYLTGWIPAAPNDVIRLANMTTTSSNFSVLTSTEPGKTTGSANHSNVISSYKGVTDDNGNIIQFTIPSSATWTYFRIACGGISLASIITKNEPIE
jgi:hypothetical protein